MKKTDILPFFIIFTILLFFSACNSEPVSVAVNDTDSSSDSDSELLYIDKDNDGWICKYPGQKCTLADRCGDSIVNISSGEACDDGNTVDGDGCSANC